MKLPFPTVRAVLAQAVRVFARFPFVMLCAAAGTACAVLQADANALGLQNVIMAAALGVPLMFGLRLMRERWLPDPARGLVLECAGLLAVAAYLASLPSDADRYPACTWIQFLVLDAGLHLAVAFVPALACAGDAAFWQFNRRLFQRFALGALYSAVLFVGLTLAIASADKLFALTIDSKRYFELWLVMVGLFNTLFFLGGAPQGWDELERDTSYPRGLRAFAQFALAPLVIVFVAILYLYAVKIVLARAWPHGWVALPVCSLGVVGILAALLLQPARDIEDERWARWYWKFFFRALGPLSLLLLLSLRERISAYGVTEARYYGLIVGVWLLVVAVCFTWRPRGSTRLVPASLAAACFLSVAGPWGAFSVSRASQRQALLSILAPAGAVENGALVPAKRPLSPKERDSARSILTHLIGTYGAGSLKGLFTAYQALAKKAAHRDLDDGNVYLNVESVVAFIGGGAAPVTNAVRAPRPAAALEVSLDLAPGLSVSGYGRLLHSCLCPGGPPQAVGDLTVQFPEDGSPARIAFGGAPLDVADVTARMASVVEAGRRGARRLTPPAMSARVASGAREWLLVVDKLKARAPANGRVKILELELYVLEK